MAPLNKLEKGTPPGESSPVGTRLCKHVILLWKVKGLTFLQVHPLRSRAWIEFQSLNQPLSQRPFCKNIAELYTQCCLYCFYLVTLLSSTCNTNLKILGNCSRSSHHVYILPNRKEEEIKDMPLSL